MVGLTDYDVVLVCGFDELAVVYAATDGYAGSVWAHFDTIEAS